MNIISIQDVSKKYEQHIALDHVSLDIPKGSIYGLLGPNGAGKTTLIRILNRIILPDSGQVSLNGSILTDEAVRKIGYLPEERGLYTDMKIGEQLVYLGRLKGMSEEDSKEQIMFWFNRLNMKGFGSKKVTELSKGMAQKVQFVLAVLHRPELLIFDEVFSGFDPVNAHLIKDQIAYLNQQGTTILFSSHRMENVEELCTHVALINQAQLVLNGEIDDIKNRFKLNRFLVVLDKDAELVDNHTFTVLEHEKNQYTIELKENYSTNEALQYIIGVGKVIEFKEMIPSLNEIFIETVRHEG